MKVLIVPSWYAERNEKLPGGIFHTEFAKEMSKRCDVAIYYPFDKTLQDNMVSEVEDGILTYRSRFVAKQKIGNRIRIYKMFRTIMKEFNPDIIHAQVATEAGRYAAFFSLLNHKPLVITEHSTVECAGVNKGIGKLYGRFVYSTSQANVCVSEDLQHKLEKIFPNRKFITVYNGVKDPQIGNKCMTYRKEGTVNIVLIAYLYSADIKGIQNVLPALRILRNEGFRITLHIVGDGEYKKYFQEMSREYQVDNQCIFYGSCSKQKVFEIISQMDFLLSASLLESFGCTIAEAMYLGKPVLVTKSGGPESFVNDNVGMLIDKGSKDAIVVGIKEMIKKLSEYDSNKIMQYAKDNFGISNIGEKYLEVYREVVEKEK